MLCARSNVSRREWFFRIPEKSVSRWSSIGVPNSLITIDFVCNTGKCADRHLLASHLPRPTEMPSFRGSHSPDTCVPRNQWSVRCFRNGYRHTQDHCHRIWGNHRSFFGHVTFVVLRTTVTELYSNATDVGKSMDPALGKSVEGRFLGRCPKYHFLDTNC